MSASKNIIICCDGTSNEFGRVNTNVVRLFQCLDLSAEAGQVAYYDPGVGTLASPGMWTRAGRALSRAFGLAFGVGIFTNIEQALAFLMQQYVPGDRVFIFGFSRGAYTARAIAGLLHKCGLPQAGAENLMPYVRRIFRNTREWDVSRSFKQTFCRPCPVTFLGLWDTVSTIGWVYNPQHLPYTRTNPEVAVIRHAVALDERRCFYRTNLWAQPAAGAPRTEQDVKEVWFAGVHSDVGGGYPPADSMLWKCSFGWMVQEASAAGVKFVGRAVQEFLGDPSATAPWHNSAAHQSLKGIWWLCECLPKKYWDDHIDPPCYRFRVPLGGARRVPAGAQLHRSIIERMQAWADYRPPNLDAGFVKRVVATPPATETVLYKPDTGDSVKPGSQPSAALGSG
jgi:uncharacterized protein (DUF2235 family)